VEFTVTESIAATRDEVLAALVDEGYYAHLGGGDSTVRAPQLLSAVRDGATVRTSVRYAFAGSLSGPAAMVVDVDKLTWVIDTEYDTDAHAGTVVVVPDHYERMLHCRGTLALEDGGDGSTLQTVAGTLEVKVPLVSGSAEQAIYGGFTRQLGMEAAAMGEYCASQR